MKVHRRILQSDCISSLWIKNINRIALTKNYFNYHFNSFILEELNTLAIKDKIHTFKQLLRGYIYETIAF